MEEPKPQQDNKLHQFRERGGESTVRSEGRPPYPNEVVGARGPPFHATGADALSPLLMQVAFPVTKEALIEQLGHARIPVDRTTTRTIREVLEQTVPDRFEGSRDVELAVDRALHDIQDSRGKGDRFTKRRPR